MQKAILIFIYLGMISCKVQSQKTDTTTSTPISEIHFQDHFVNDTVTLNINGIVVFEKGIVNTDRAIGLSNLVLRIFSQESKNKIVINKNEFYCDKFSNNSMPIMIIINKKEKRVNVDLTKGKFVGFSKEKDLSISMTQSETMFIYD